MDRDEAIFTANANALAALDLIELLFGYNSIIEPKATVSAVEAEAGQLRRVLAKPAPAYEPLGREALFRAVAQIKLERLNTVHADALRR